LHVTLVCPSPPSSDFARADSPRGRCVLVRFFHARHSDGCATLGSARATPPRCFAKPRSHHSNSERNAPRRALVEFLHHMFTFTFTFTLPPPAHS
jgi:hypothetical protein